MKVKILIYLVKPDFMQLACKSFKWESSKPAKDGGSRGTDFFGGPGRIQSKSLSNINYFSFILTIILKHILYMGKGPKDITEDSQL